MDLIISILLSTRLLTFLGGLGGGHSEVRFSPPQIAVAPTAITMNCSLIHAFSPELKELANTGTPVLLYLFVELYENNQKQPVAAVAVESSLLYDLVARQYRVFFSPGGDTLIFGSLDSAIAASCSFKNVLLISLDRIREIAAYHIVSFAILGKTRVEALRNREIDLMYYWDFRRPSMKTDEFSGKQLLALRKSSPPSNAQKEAPVSGPVNEPGEKE
jgi:hypothetical protein